MRREPCTTLRRDKHALSVDSVSAGLIAVRVAIKSQSSTHRARSSESSRSLPTRSAPPASTAAACQLHQLSTSTTSHPVPVSYRYRSQRLHARRHGRRHSPPATRRHDQAAAAVRNGAWSTIAPGRDVVADLVPPLTPTRRGRRPLDLRFARSARPAAQIATDRSASFVVHRRAGNSAFVVSEMHGDPDARTMPQRMRPALGSVDQSVPFTGSHPPAD